MEARTKKARGSNRVVASSILPGSGIDSRGRSMFITATDDLNMKIKRRGTTFSTGPLPRFAFSREPTRRLLPPARRCRRCSEASIWWTRPTTTLASPWIRTNVRSRASAGRLSLRRAWERSSTSLFGSPRDIATSARLEPPGPFAQRVSISNGYAAASLEFLGGFSFTYSAGKLPLDRDSDNVLALGYKLNF